MIALSNHHDQLKLYLDLINIKITLYIYILYAKRLHKVICRIQLSSFSFENLPVKFYWRNLFWLSNWPFFAPKKIRGSPVIELSMLGAIGAPKSTQ